MMTPPTSMPPNGGAPPPAGAPADRAAAAVTGVLEKMRQTIDATYPGPGAPLAVKEIVSLSEVGAKALKALGGPDAPTWEAPKGIREVPQVPQDVYRMAMLILLMAAKVLPPKEAAAFVVAPEDFTTDKGLAKVEGMLAQIASDKKLQAMLHDGVAKMMSGGAPMAEGEEPAPNADKGEGPHAEPDADEPDYTSM